MEDKFDQLLRNKLPKEEADSLLKEIESNPTLKQEFEEYQNSWEMVKLLERRKIKERVSQIKVQQDKPQSKRWVWYAAASIALFVLGYWNIQRSSSAESIAEQYFAPYPDKFTSMGQNDAQLTEAMKFYNKGDYSEAKALLIQAPDEYQNDIELYLGICWYQTDEKAKAKVAFKNLLKESSSIQANKAPALWYLSITHLALNEIDSAQTFLNILKEDSTIAYHREDVIDILEKLE